MIYSNFVPYQMRVSAIKITSYKDRIASGTISNPFYTQSVPFYGVVQLISLIENLCEELNCPEKTMEMRGFTEPAKQMKLTPCPRPESVQGPALATFKLTVYFMQNASWQGCIAWDEKEQAANFRSVLELICLMDGALIDLV